MSSWYWVVRSLQSKAKKSIHSNTDNYYELMNRGSGIVNVYVRRWRAHINL